MNKDIKIASAGRRILAHLIDCLITLLAMTGVWVWVVSLSSIEQMLNGLLALVGILIISSWAWMFYVSMMTTKLGGTIGKLLTGIEIVNLEGKRISFWRAFFRNVIGYSVSGMALWLGFIWIAVDKERRGWHDMMAGTMVVEKRKSGAVAGVIGLIGIIVMIVLMGIKIAGQVKHNLPFYQNLAKDVSLSARELFFSGRSPKSDNNYQDGKLQLAK